MAKGKYVERKWMLPSKRAKGYAEDRKAKVHTYGKNEGKELSEYELGLRSGYLLAQSDHVGIFKYFTIIKKGRDMVFIFFYVIFSKSFKFSK